MENCQDPAELLNELLASAGLPKLGKELSRRFQAYLDLLMHWNARVNLTAIREPGEILSRHFVESIASARAVPEGTATLLDFGSGAGFPGIPIALCRPDIRVTLAESKRKKAAFLREAVRVLGLNTTVYAGRAESLDVKFDCVAMRAVDRMEQAVAEGAKLVAPGGFLLVMTMREEEAAIRGFAGAAMQWMHSEVVPFSHGRMIAVARRTR